MFGTRRSPRRPILAAIALGSNLMITPSVAQVVRATGIPAFVKSASLEDGRDYDFRTRESTYISYVTALTKQASGNELQSCIDHAKFWNIEEDCGKVKTKLAELMHAPELTDADFALVFKDDGNTIRKFASYDSPTLVEAAINFYDSRSDFPYELRAQAATHLLAKTGSHKAILPDYIYTYLQKAAAFGALGVKELEDALIERDQHCTSEYRDEFSKVACIIESMIEIEALRCDHDFIKSAMSTIDNYDAITEFPGNLIEESVSGKLTVSELQKVAAEQQFTVKLINGCEVDVRGLKKEALAAVDPELSYMNHEKLIGILPTLPRNDADLLSRLI